MAIRRCSVAGCETKFFAKEMCQRHYYRIRRNGTLVPVQRHGEDKYDSDGNKWCSRCKTYLPLDLFNPTKHWCKECTRLGRYKLTKEQFNSLLGGNGLCPLCAKRKATCVDHDHSCCAGRDTCGKCVRGILCNRCNGAIGTLTEEGIVRTLNYLGKTL